MEQRTGNSEWDGLARAAALEELRTNARWQVLDIVIRDLDDPEDRLIPGGGFRCARLEELPQISPDGLSPFSIL